MRHCHVRRLHWRSQTKKHRLGSSDGLLNCCHGLAVDTCYDQPLWLGDREIPRLCHFDFDKHGSKCVEVRRGVIRPILKLLVLKHNEPHSNRATSYRFFRLRTAIVLILLARLFAHYRI